jgi:hypothetical protein
MPTPTPTRTLSPTFTNLAAPHKHQLKQPKHDLHVTLKSSHEMSGDLNVNTSLEHGVVALAATPP